MTGLEPAAAAKAALTPLRSAMTDFDADAVRSALARVFHPDAVVRLAFPFGTMTGPLAFQERALAPLAAAWPDLERRDHIVISGLTNRGDLWVGCCGHYLGTFTMPWLDIPPTGHPTSMRFHEFFRFEEGRVVEVQALWDIPEVMMQAGAWPMAPSLGREWLVPGPATQDGIRDAVGDPATSARSLALVIDMLTALCRHPAQGGPELMELERYWHPRMNWYGPAGVGTARGIVGFRRKHQIPFLNAMPDRGQDPTGTESHFFADGAYVAVTGWPNMRQTLSHGGWLGLPPVGKAVTLKSLDFWRVEGDFIRENWVLFDVLDLYDQLGVDVFCRMRELTDRTPAR